MEDYVPPPRLSLPGPQSSHHPVLLVTGLKGEGMGAHGGLRGPGSASQDRPPSLPDPGAVLRPGGPQPHPQWPGGRSRTS